MWECEYNIILYTNYTSIKEKENVIYTHNRILLSLKQEGNHVICNNRSEPTGHYGKWNNPVTGQILMIPLIEESKIDT